MTHGGYAGVVVFRFHTISERAGGVRSQHVYIKRGHVLLF